MACLERASPALKEVLLKLHRAEIPREIDHHIYEFGSVKYHIQASASDPYHVYLSVSTPLLSQGTVAVDSLPHSTLETVKRFYSDIVEVIEPQRGGYQLTLRLNFDKLPHGKECIKVISNISSVQALILSSQLKEMLWNLGSQEISQGTYKPIKLVYHPREPFFVIRLPQKITAVFPMRFRDSTDVIIATAFFQELMDAGCSEACAKAPPCTWSPIPPPELRDIFSQHVEGTKLDKTVWSLLNFSAYVKYHVKCTRGFIQRRMRKRLENLSEVLQISRTGENELNTEVQGYRCMRKLIGLSKPKNFRRKCGTFTKKFKRIHSPIKIHGFDRFRQRWLKIPKCHSFRRNKLD
ncbi:PREDICTED: actin-related protein 2/3 complex subunit 2B isoform X2 [Nelumbo nucifera]|uniref:Arp2/3 complex 34 kDa subunit n=1 Tax=Nelumbo nucifera TaxID=4432 RepID=A0A1U8A5F4_NELNU|nr:PREDICTED: actin-related protein 2/3 complex subunit 2B isoform X2 [Nelumbo nucifera]